jgi:lipopolysaccharide assembly protein A
MSTARKLFGLSLAISLALIAAVFASNNPAPISIDTGFARFDEVSLSLVLVLTLAIGWLLGLATVGFALWRSNAERRRLQRDLRLAETELSSLRSLPLNDAD